jgi:hypothetical protein
MARIRTIKPEFWADEKLGHLPPIDRLVFLGLISLADDAGRLVDSVRQLDGLLFPYTSDSCEKSLETLARLSRVRRYSSDSGQRIIQIVEWARHQRVDKPAKHVLPGPPTQDVTDTALTESSRESPEDVARMSRESRAPTLDLGPTTLERGASRTHARDGEPSAGNPTAGLDDLITRSIRGCYGGPGREGTDERVWSNVADPADRERMLATAVIRWQGSGHAEFNGKFFRTILQAVVAEQSEPAPQQASSSKFVGGGFQAYDADFEPGGWYGPPLEDAADA